MNANILRRQSINHGNNHGTYGTHGTVCRTNRIITRFTAKDKYCKDCIHFAEDTSYPVGSLEAKRYGFCTLFTVRDIVSGEFRYVHARTIRMKDIPGVPTCGIKANFHEVRAPATANVTTK